MKRATYWGVLTPDDNGEPEMFFKDEQFALASIAMVTGTMAPEDRGLMRLVRVTVDIIDVENVGVEGVAQG